MNSSDSSQQGLFDRGYRASRVAARLVGVAGAVAIFAATLAGCTGEGSDRGPATSADRALYLVTTGEAPGDTAPYVNVVGRDRLARQAPFFRIPPVRPAPVPPDPYARRARTTSSGAPASAAASGTRSTTPAAAKKPATTPAPKKNAPAPGKKTTSGSPAKSDGPADAGDVDADTDEKDKPAAPKRSAAAARIDKLRELYIAVRQRFSDRDDEIQFRQRALSQNIAAYHTARTKLHLRPGDPLPPNDADFRSELKDTRDKLAVLRGDLTKLNGVLLRLDGNLRAGRVILRAFDRAKAIKGQTARDRTHLAALTRAMRLSQQRATALRLRASALLGGLVEWASSQTQALDTMERQVVAGGARRRDTPWRDLLRRETLIRSSSSDKTDAKPGNATTGSPAPDKGRQGRAADEDKAE